MINKWFTICPCSVVQQVLNCGAESSMWKQLDVYRFASSGELKVFSFPSVERNQTEKVRNQKAKVKKIPTLLLLFVQLCLVLY